MTAQLHTITKSAAAQCECGRCAQCHRRSRTQLIHSDRQRSDRVDPAADSTWVPILGAVRRIQSLITSGHTQEYLQRRLGVSAATMRQLTGRPVRNDRNAGEQITAALHRRVHALWNELQMHPGSSDIARRIGAKYGWPVPFMWDEDRIDDPAAKPVACRRSKNSDLLGQRAENRDQRAELLRAVVAATLRGDSGSQIAEQLAITDRTVLRYRAKARRKGLLDPVVGGLSEAS
ncbi:hypothetical protein [Nocardia wallacei]|uniref:hypothetical protein n=1 Tax=Nocardia wallacei TaxID=480035 RepID=UPI00245833ED|nr:hypothetical protein [Nocardia wallacei]